MDLKRTSHEFHRQLESPLEFARRERRMLALCAGLFCAAMLAVVVFVDPAFFYARISADPLNYILKAQHFLTDGNLRASWAVNLKPFAYVSMPGVLRLPAVAAFPEFDHQLRAMQVMNIPLVASVAAMSAYIFSWVLPRSRHSLAIGFAFAFTFVSPVWLANVFLPLADAPYALFTLATIFTGLELLRSERPVKSRPVMLAAFAVLFTVSFLLRFTAPVVLFFLAPLALARWRAHNHSARTLWTGAAVASLAVAALIYLNTDAIFGRYFSEPISFVRRGDKTGMLVNLFGAAFPTQIIPTFQLGFLHPPIVNLFSTSFFTSTRDLAWAAAGGLFSIVIVAGMWLTRRPLLPEILYVLGALPILALMMPSTTRYLMPYQAFFWIFFYSGAAVLAARYAPWVKRLVQSRVAVASTVGALLLLVIGLRAWKTAGTAAERYHIVNAAAVPDYIAEVASTFRSLRNYLETLPRERTLLIGHRGVMGRWKAISGLDYVFPDSAIAKTAGGRDTYLVVECGTLDGCLAWDVFRSRVTSRVTSVTKAEFDPVFSAANGRARAEVLRVRFTD